MKVWFDGKTLYWDLIYDGITPQWVEIPDTIKEIKVNENDVLIKGAEAGWIVQNITDPRRMVVYDMRLRRHPLFLDDIYKQEFPHKA